MALCCSRCSISGDACHMAAGQFRNECPDRQPDSASRENLFEHMLQLRIAVRPSVSASPGGCLDLEGRAASSREHSPSHHCRPCGLYNLEETGSRPTEP